MIKLNYNSKLILYTLVYILVYLCVGIKYYAHNFRKMSDCRAGEM